MFTPLLHTPLHIYTPILHNPSLSDNRCILLAEWALRNPCFSVSIPFNKHNIHISYSTHPHIHLHHGAYPTKEDKPLRVEVEKRKGRKRKEKLILHSTITYKIRSKAIMPASSSLNSYIIFVVQTRGSGMRRNFPSSVMNSIAAGSIGAVHRFS